MRKLWSVVVLTTALSSAQAFPGVVGPNNLNPVHSLFVKPSADGSTGDLYVAATEENGVQSQWLTDQPVSFLPAQHALTAYPFGPSAALSHDESVNQKRSVISNPAFKYAYALPAAAAADGKVLPYTYTTGVPAVQASPGEGNKECPGAAPITQLYPQYQYQSPFQYYYPHMMAAFAGAINELKEAGVSEEDASSLISQIMPQSAPAWPTYAYPQYPVQYVMVDPSTWAQAQAAAVTTAAPTAQPVTTTPATTISDNSDESI